MRRRVHLEQLEPRVLLSADPLSAALVDAAAWLPDPGSADQRESHSDALRELTSAGVNADLRAELKVGDPAPDFELPAHDGSMVKLSDHLGKSNVIVTTYRAHW